MCIRDRDRFDLLLEAKNLAELYPQELLEDPTIFRADLAFRIHSHLRLHRPSRKGLEENLRQFPSGYTAANAYHQSRFFQDIGEFERSLAEAEKAWSSLGDSGRQYHDFSYVGRVVYASIACTNRESAKQWLATGARVVADHDCQNCRKKYLEDSGRYALASNESRDELEQRLKESLL